MARLRTMRQLVDRVPQCRCAELSDCGRIAISIMGGLRNEITAWYLLAALGEIGGCFSFWTSTHAGRAYAAYGGIDTVYQCRRISSCRG